MAKSDKNTQTYGRITEIDTLRGISIIAVILTHINQRAPIEKTFLGQYLHPQVVSFLFKNGYLGVIIFFVISGFLITSSSIKRWGALPNVNIQKFYSIRFARIAPCLIALLSVLSFLHSFNVTGFVIDPQKSSFARAIFSALTFHLNWLEAKVGYLPGSWDVLWSLCVEEAFYLFFPITCVLLKKRVHFVLFMFAFIVLGPISRTLITNEIWQDHSYLSCMDGIAFGCLTALFIEKFKLSGLALQRVKWAARVLFFGSLFFKKQLFQLGITDSGLNVTLLEIATAFMIVSIHGHLARGKLNESRLTLPIRWFGRNSYEVYLSHMFFITAFSNTPFMDKNGSPVLLFGFLLILVLSGIFGDLVSRTFSEPTNRWLRARLVPKLKYSYCGT